MCRWAAWRGSPLFLEDIVCAPTHSLVAQSHHARQGITATNGDGFGIAWYGERPEPGLYRDVLPAWSDCNLKSLARQIRSPLFLAHVRASTVGATQRDNCHPFVHGRWSFMHNGHVAGFARIERRLENRLCERLYGDRAGATDSELLFLLAVQCGLAADPRGAFEAAVRIVAEEASRASIDTQVRLTAAFSDGVTLYAIRYATDGKAPSLFLRTCANGGCRLVSEPLDDEGAQWRPVPEASFVAAGPDDVTIAPFSPFGAALALTG